MNSLHRDTGTPGLRDTGTDMSKRGLSQRKVLALRLRFIFRIFCKGPLDSSVVTLCYTLKCQRLQLSALNCHWTRSDNYH